MAPGKAELVVPGRPRVVRAPGHRSRPTGSTRNSEQALRSLDALASISADVVLPGHGEPWTDGVAEAVRLANAAGRS